jgi:hypothetical protein
MRGRLRVSIDLIFEDIKNETDAAPFRFPIPLAFGVRNADRFALSFLATKSTDQNHAFESP